MIRNPSSVKQKISASPVHYIIRFHYNMIIFSECGGKCGGDVNSNYAPINSNVQNFVNVETDINTNFNMNIGSFGKQLEQSESSLITLEDIVQILCQKLDMRVEDFGDLLGKL